MDDIGPETSFRGLPLSAEQEAEIQHYIHQRRRRGLEPDPAELRGMLQDMLEPPVDEALLEQFTVGPNEDAERAADRIENYNDPIEAFEERTAAGEAEAMKRR
jgi:hypothetical protein